jgi:aspartyl-tRNA(Asn)/glutamyl-tRNA(Gln) amidotransferase subunit A
MTPLALGSDTGGSIRLPAAYCGVVGFKPSFGRVPVAGCWPLCPTLDHAGPMARTADVCALLLAAISDWTTSTPDLADLVVGVPETFAPSLDADVDAAVRAVARALEDAGARVETVTLPDAQRCFDVYRTTMLAEALAVHERAGLWPARRDEYPESVAARLPLAERVTLDDYRAAAAEREALRAEIDAVFERVDLLLTPVSAVPAPRSADERFEHRGAPTTLRDAVVPFVCPQNLLGLPACAVPGGLDRHGVPVGVQVSGPRGADALVLAAAAAGATPLAPPDAPGSASGPRY